MTVHNFYNGYTIDDANIGCDKVIVSTCPGEHIYKSVCELIQDCLPDPQLTNPCVVDFLNSNLSSKNGQYLKVSGNCITTGPLECPCDDRYVVATEGDPAPGTLDQKLETRCSSDGLYCIVKTTPNPRHVVLTPSGPNNPFTRAPNEYPECDNAQVRMKSDGSIEYKCVEDDQPYRRRYCRLWTGGASLANYPRQSAHKINLGPHIPIDWTYTNFTGTDGFAVDKAAANSVGDLFYITDPGVYQISYVSLVWADPMIHAIRAGCTVGPYTRERCGDIKYGSDRHELDCSIDMSGTGGMVTMQQTPHAATFIVWLTSEMVSGKGAPVKFEVKPDTRYVPGQFNNYLVSKCQNESDPVRIGIANGDPEYGSGLVVSCEKIGNIVDDNFRQYQF